MADQEKAKQPKTITTITPELKAAFNETNRREKVYRPRATKRTNDSYEA